MNDNEGNHNKDIFDGPFPGSLHIWLVRDPDHWSLEQWISHKNDEASYLGFDFRENERDALFLHELHCPTAPESIRGEDVEEFHERLRKGWKAAIPEYPMLGRIFDMYTDYGYTTMEVEQLREECLRVRKRISHPEAVKGIEKLLYACDRALQYQYGLMLMCD